MYISLLITIFTTVAYFTLAERQLMSSMQRRMDLPLYNGAKLGVKEPFGHRTISTNNVNKNTVPSLTDLQTDLNLPSVPLYVWTYDNAWSDLNRNLLAGLSGIYIWYNLYTRLGYVGSTRNLYNRPYFHTRPSGTNVGAQEFRDTLMTFGRERYVLIICEFGLPTNIVSTDDVLLTALYAREDIYLASVPVGRLYNLSESASGPKSVFARSEAFKQNASEKQLDTNNSNYGKVTSDDSKRKMRYAKQSTFVSFDAVNLTTGVVTPFASIADCMAATGASRMQVSRAVNMVYGSNVLKVKGVPTYRLVKTSYFFAAKKRQHNSDWLLTITHTRTIRRLLS